MYVVVENELAGLISVNDPIRDSTIQALNFIRKEGLYIVMVTGDNRITANAVAKKLGIDNVEAEIFTSK